LARENGFSIDELGLLPKWRHRKPLLEPLLNQKTGDWGDVYEEEGSRVIDTIT